MLLESRKSLHLMLSSPEVPLRRDFHLGKVDLEA